MMTAVWVGVYVVVGLVVGGIAVATILHPEGAYGRFKDEKEVATTTAIIVIAWPVALGIGVIAGLGWLAYKGAEWIGDWIWVLIQVQKGGKP